MGSLIRLRQSVMRWSAALFIVIGAAQARSGTVWTLDGRAYDGEVHLSMPDQVTVTPGDGAPVHVEMARVLRVALHSPALAEGTSALVGAFIPYELGNVGKAAAVSFTDGVFVIAGNGVDMSGGADNIHFFAQNIQGNGEVTARVDQISRGNARVGLMIRSGREPEARNASLVVDSSGELSFRFRQLDGKGTTLTSAGKVSLPIYLRLVRADRQFYGYKSLDGRAWNLVGRVYQDRAGPAGAPPAAAGAPPGPQPGIDMRPAALAGFAFAGGMDGAGGSGIIEQVAIREYRGAPAGGGDAPPPPAEFMWTAQEYANIGTLLHSGTFITGTKAGDFGSKGARLTCLNRTVTIPLAQVCRAQFHNLSAGTIAAMPDRTTGLLLNGGDFIEGDVSKLGSGKVEVNNVTLGLATFDVAREVQAFVLRELDAAPAGYRIQLVNGCVLLVRGMRINVAGDLDIDEYTMGDMAVSASQVVSIQAGVEHVVALTALRPAKLTAPAGFDVVNTSVFNPAEMSWMAVQGNVNERGIVAPAGTALVYNVPAGARALACNVGVPARVPSKAAVRFIIDVDGREIVRTQPRTSRMGPLFLVCAPLAGASTLTLHVEASDGTEFPGFGLWGDPLFIK